MHACMHVLNVRVTILMDNLYLIVCSTVEALSTAHADPPADKGVCQSPAVWVCWEAICKECVNLCLEVRAWLKALGEYCFTPAGFPAPDGVAAAKGGVGRAHAAAVGATRRLREPRPCGLAVV